MSAKTKRKPAKREKPPDARRPAGKSRRECGKVPHQEISSTEDIGLALLLRKRRPRGGFVVLAKYSRLKSVAA
jgi:hypothetical protein